MSTFPGPIGPDFGRGQGARGPEGPGQSRPADQAAFAEKVGMGGAGPAAGGDPTVRLIREQLASGASSEQILERIVTAEQEALAGKPVPAQVVSAVLDKVRNDPQLMRIFDRLIRAASAPGST